MSQEERLVESLLLKVRWQQTENGIEGELIKIRNYKIYIQNKLQECTRSSYEIWYLSHLGLNKIKMKWILLTTTD